MNRSKQRGTAWESAIVTTLRELGVPHAERRALNGAADKGDIAGIPGVVIEAKNAARTELGSWVDEAVAERDNARASVGVVWHKRRGRAHASLGYVTMPGWQFVQLLREAGYIGTGAFTHGGTVDVEAPGVPGTELPGMWDRSDFEGGPWDA